MRLESGIENFSSSVYTDRMTWLEIRKQYPNTWLLLEAIKAHSKNDYRILDELSVISRFDDSESALDAYSQLHEIAPARELLVLHTSQEKLEIKERFWMGIRMAA
jgi:hypothetical protein